MPVKFNQVALSGVMSLAAVVTVNMPAQAQSHGGCPYNVGIVRESLQQKIGNTLRGYTPNSSQLINLNMAIFQARRINNDPRCFNRELEEDISFAQRVYDVREGERSCILRSAFDNSRNVVECLRLEDLSQDLVRQIERRRNNNRNIRKPSLAIPGINLEDDGRGKYPGLL